MAGSLGFGRQYCIPKGKASAEYRFPQTVKHCVGLREPGSLDRVTTLKSATAHGPCFFTGLMPPKSQRPLPSAPIIHIAARFYARRRKAIYERFFESNLVTLKEAPDRGAAARNLVLAHRQNHFVQRQVRLLLNQTQQKIRMLLQW